MNTRAVRAVLLVLTLGFLLAAFISSRKMLMAGGFLVCGSLWYWLVRLKAQELDGSR
jgi:hypothetical protein